jgi:DNA (cytosine-5)-methyltransferase 1
MTYSFPCQDLSVAGKQRGMTKGSGTRSGLLWEVERLLNEVENLPKVLLMENVPQVHGKKNMDDFQRWIQFLESKGYSNYWQDLNAKNYGVAQNRNRCFMVSILGSYRYEFPKPIELTKRMKDYLEDEVDEKYYINNEKAQKLIATLIENGALAQPQQGKIGYIEKGTGEHQTNQVFGKDGLSPCIDACQYKQPYKVCVDLSANEPSEKV